MPPQAAVLGAALAWNYQRSCVGKGTLSQFAREHPSVFIVGWAGLNAWLIPHILATRRP